jgi:thiol:disulfide interchange protein DsbA
MKPFFVAIGMAAMLAIPSAHAGVKHEIVKSPQSALDKQDSRIEVESIFSYDCPVCYQLDPAVMELKEKYKDDIQVIHVPAPLNETWAVYSRAYYIAEALGILDEAHQIIFDAVVQGDGKTLLNGADMAKFFRDNFLIDSDKTLALYKSVVVRDKLVRNYQRLKEYELVLVPALVIDGKYLVTGHSAGSVKGMVTEAEAIIAKIKASRTSASIADATPAKQPVAKTASL